MWSEVWNLHCLIFPWWLERMFNRTKLPNLNFKAILSSVFISWIFSLCSFSAFLWPENAIAGKRSFCLRWYDASNLQCFFFPRWLVQTGLLGISTFKLDVIFSHVFGTQVIFSGFKKSTYLMSVSLLIFSILMTWKRDFWTTIIFHK